MTRSDFPHPTETQFTVIRPDQSRQETAPFIHIDPAAFARTVCRACAELAREHAAGQTFGGRLQIGPDGLVGAPGPVVDEATDFADDLAALRHVAESWATSVRGAGRADRAARAVADALIDVGEVPDPLEFAREFRHALANREQQSRQRVASERAALGAHERALASQRRLRDELAARLARLDASIAGQEDAVGREETRRAALDQELRGLARLVNMFDDVGGLLTHRPGPIDAVDLAENDEPAPTRKARVSERIAAIGAMLSF
ncbi:MAG: hypothetical protein KC620_04475 [Myxococcales bacterium]|nr:hypothetical protein [Myxococcales bacterium]